MDTEDEFDEHPNQRLDKRFKLPGTDFYVIDHSTNLFLFDLQGKLRLVAPHAISAENLAKDLQSLLDAPHKVGD